MKAIASLAMLALLVFIVATLDEDSMLLALNDNRPCRTVENMLVERIANNSEKIDKLSKAANAQAQLIAQLTEALSTMPSYNPRQNSKRDTSKLKTRHSLSINRSFRCSDYSYGHQSSHEGGKPLIPSCVHSSVSEAGDGLPNGMPVSPTHCVSYNAQPWYMPDAEYLGCLIEAQSNSNQSSRSSLREIDQSEWARDAHTLQQQFAAIQNPRGCKPYPITNLSVWADFAQHNGLPLKQADELRRQQVLAV
jgi:hypothetical protein